MDQETEDGEDRRQHIYVTGGYRINARKVEVNHYPRHDDKDEAIQNLRHGDNSYQNAFLSNKNRIRYHYIKASYFRRVFLTV
jgi:methyl coenzyme M reductase alpha subunit